MTIECSRSVHSIVLRMAQVNSNVFTSAISIKKAACSVKKYAERVFRPGDRRLRSAVNGSGQLCRPGVYVIYEYPFAPKGVE
mgnify:FL=1